MSYDSEEFGWWGRDHSWVLGFTVVLEGNNSKRRTAFLWGTGHEQRMQSRVKVDEMQLGPQARYGRYARDGIPGTIATCCVGVRRFLFQVNRSSGDQRGST